jgi:hypothetical protein
MIEQQRYETFFKLPNKKSGLPTFFSATLIQTPIALQEHLYIFSR